MAKATLDEATHTSPLEAVIEHRLFRHTITFLIVANAVVLGILTYSEHLPGGLVLTLGVFDMIVTLAFVVELCLKLAVYRFQFFRLGWNWFDFIVIGVSLIPGGSAFTVLRALRVLRVLRLLHVMPTMRRITEALLKALPGMGAILAILGLVFYVGVVMATYLFSGAQNTANFADLGTSALTMFEVLTMEGWNGYMHELLEEYPWAWAFFIPFILFTVWVILNLFTAVIVDSLQEEALETVLEKEQEMEEQQEKAEEKRHRELLEEIAALKDAVRTLTESR